MSRRVSGERWQTLLGLLPDAIVVVARPGEVLFANRPAGRLLGTGSDLVGRRLHDVLANREEEVDGALRRWSRSSSLVPASLTSRAGPRTLRVEGARVSGGSDETAVVLRLRQQDQAIRAFTQLDRQVSALTREVSRRMRAESLLDGQLRILESIARGAPLERTLTEIASLVESRSTGALCSILLLEGRRIRHGAAPSLPGDYNEAIDGVEIGPAVGSCGTAMHRGEPVVVSDIANDPLWADFRDLALAHDLKACWSYPVIEAEGRVLGSLALYYRERREPDESDRRLTELGCSLTEIAVEKAVRELELRLRAQRLEAADQAKDEFLAMLGHELRNPLGPMLATLELIRANPDSGSLDSRVDVLERQTRHLARLVDDLLDVSRITRGLIELQLDPVDLVEVVHSAARLVEAEAGRQSVVLMVDAPDSAVWVEGDRDRLTQVVYNLLQNAFKYSESGSTVQMRVSVEDGQALLEVSDEGAGIDPAFLPRVFELFSQAPQHSDRRQGGLGMGLTLVKLLVEAHGGTVAVASEGLGKGTRFLLSIPLGERPLQEEESAAATEIATAAGSLEVLVVEDHEDSATAVKALLELWGHRCHLARDGGQAMTMAAVVEPALVLLDIGLPLLDGFEVVRRLREDERYAPERCLIVALTGYGQKADRERGLAAGFDDYLAKPIDPARLEQLLEAATERCRPSSA